MKLTNSRIVRRCAALALACGAIGWNHQANAQIAVEINPPVVVAPAVAYQPRTMQDLQQLTANIALYPDAVLAQMMVASTYPDQVVAAAQYLQAQGDPGQIANQPWDASVKGLTQAPDALNLMAGNVDWMCQLGGAYVNQSVDLFTAIQSLRAAAANAGNLVSNPQMVVTTDQRIIQIVPANPRVIFLPRYDASVVYFTRGTLFRPFITFGDPVPVGIWLGHDFDWHDNAIYSGDWASERPWWHHDHDHGYMDDRPGVFVNNTNVTNVTNVKIVNRTNISVREHMTDVTRQRYDHVVTNHDMPKIGPNRQPVNPTHQTPIEHQPMVPPQPSHTPSNVPGITHTPGLKPQIPMTAPKPTPMLQPSRTPTTTTPVVTPNPAHKPGNVPMTAPKPTPMLQPARSPVSNTPGVTPNPAHKPSNVPMTAPKPTPMLQPARSPVSNSPGVTPNPGLRPSQSPVTAPKPMPMAHNSPVANPTTATQPMRQPQAQPRSQQSPMTSGNRPSAQQPMQAAPRHAQAQSGNVQGHRQNF